jgi:hypothetical protein
VLGDFGWPLILFAVVALPLLRFSNSDARWLLLYFTGHFALWFLSKPVLRFLIGALPIGVVLASLAIRDLIDMGGRIARLTVVLTLPFLASNFFLYWFIAGELKSYTVSMGTESRSDYLQKRLAFYSAFEFANSEIPPGNRLLLIGEQRTYHLRVPFTASNLFAPSQISRWCNESKSKEDLLARLRESNLGYVLINEPEMDRLGGLAAFGFTSAGAQRLTMLLQEGATARFDQNGIRVLQIEGVGK